MQKLKDSNKIAANFQSKRKQTAGLRHNKKELNYKREQQLLCAALSQQLQQESGTEMDTLVSGVKKTSKKR
jgi:outer membrane protein